MPEETMDEPKIPPEFAKMKAVLDQLKEDVESWEGNKKFNLHLLRSDQLKTEEWADFCKVFLFPLYPKETTRNYVKLLKKTGNLDPLTSFFNNLPGVNVNLIEELQKDKGANFFVDQMLRSPHLGEIVEEKMQMIAVMSPAKELDDLLEDFRAKHKDIRWLQDAFFRWLTYINYFMLFNLIMISGGHRAKAQLEKENENLTGEIMKFKRRYIKLKRQLGDIDASLLGDPGFIPKELKRIDSLIETCDRFIGLFQSIASLRKPGKPINLQLYSLLSSLSLSVPGGHLSSCKNEIVSLVYYLFQRTGLSDKKVIPSFNKFNSSPLGRQTLRELQQL